MIDLEQASTKLLLFEMLRDGQGKLRDLLDFGTDDKGVSVKAFLLDEFLAGFQCAQLQKKE